MGQWIFCVCLLGVVSSVPLFAKKEVVEVQTSRSSGRTWKWTKENSRSSRNLSSIPTFLVYTVGEIDGKFASVDRALHNLRSDLEHKIAAASNSDVHERSSLRHNLKLDIEHVRAQHLGEFTALESRVNDIDRKFESSIEELPSLLSSEVLPELEQKLESNSQLIQAISAEVMEKLFEQIQAINDRLDKLEKTRV